MIQNEPVRRILARIVALSIPLGRIIAGSVLAAYVFNPPTQ